ncbi:MAG: hypothetical protein IJK12_09040 [Clostridia bacterium]|nr:hypothetical protein [Clostridia bacterium]MBR0437373.1 hypothetical protein [Clostridia bacterium]
MKQTIVREYQPKYPKKLLKGAALTAAALVALSGTACKPLLGGVPLATESTPEPQPEGIVPVDTPDETPDPNLVEPGEPMVDEGEDAESHTRNGDLMLEGKIVVDDSPNP